MGTLLGARENGSAFRSIGLNENSEVMKDHTSYNSALLRCLSIHVPGMPTHGGPLLTDHVTVTPSGKGTLPIYPH